MLVHIRSRVACLGLIVGIAVSAGACGGPPASSDRGFLKPPLTEPGVRVKYEQETEMSRLAEPNLPPVVDSPAPEGTTGN